MKTKDAGKKKESKGSNTYELVFMVILILAIITRLHMLGERLPHHDEGVFGWDILEMAWGREYYYDSELHGPFLFQITAIVFRVLGDSEFTLRLMQALFGIATVALSFKLRKWVGTAGMLTTAAFITLTPSITYYSRMAFHETFYQFFLLAMILSWFEYGQSHKNKYFYLSAFCLAMLFCIKEMAWITSGILGLYAVIWIVRKALTEKIETPIKVPPGTFRTIFTGVVIILFTITILYTSFFRTPENLSIALKEQLFFNIQKTHERTGHNKPWTYYPSVMLEYEPVVLIAGLLGALISVRRRGFQGFFAFYALAVAIIYSSIPYKTAWNLVYTAFPLTITSGFLIQRIYDRIERKNILVILVILSCVSLSYFTYKTSFVDYQDNARNEFTYVHTTISVKKMVDLIDEISLRETGGKNIEVKVVASTYWPLPWLLRDYPRKGFWGGIPQNPDAAIVIANWEDAQILDEKLEFNYFRRGFNLWPGSNLMLYVREDVWGRHLNSSPPEEGVMYLSVLPEASIKQGWGIPGKDVSVEGNPLSVGGRKYLRGLGVHANSEIIYELDGSYSYFTTVVGIDDEADIEGDYPSVEFIVYVDGNKSYESGVMRVDSEPQKVNVSLEGAMNLRLVVTDAGVGFQDNLAHGDHADWADAKLIN